MPTVLVLQSWLEIWGLQMAFGRGHRFALDFRSRSKLSAQSRDEMRPGNCASDVGNPMTSFGWNRSQEGGISLRPDDLFAMEAQLQVRNGFPC